jgi:hypothetical protein
VAGLGVPLQVVEHSVAVQLRQVPAHDHRVGHELVDERQPGVAAQREQTPEAVVVGDVHRAPRERAVAGHQERHALARRQV